MVRDKPISEYTEALFANDSAGHERGHIEGYSRLYRQLNELLQQFGREATEREGTHRVVNWAVAGTRLQPLPTSHHSERAAVLLLSSSPLRLVDRGVIAGCSLGCSFHGLLTLCDRQQAGGLEGPN
jgi:hypothetical protein